MWSAIEGYNNVGITSSIYSTSCHFLNGIISNNNNSEELYCSWKFIKWFLYVPLGDYKDLYTEKYHKKTMNYTLSMSVKLFRPCYNALLY